MCVQTHMMSRVSRAKNSFVYSVPYLFLGSKHLTQVIRLVPQVPLSLEPHKAIDISVPVIRYKDVLYFLSCSNNDVKLAAFNLNCILGVCHIQNYR